MNTTRTIIALGAAALVLAACDPRVFDDLASEAPVHSHTEPGGLESRFYGEEIASGGTIGEAGSGFYVLARNADGFGHVVVDGDGGVQVLGVDAQDLGIDGAVDAFESDVVMVGDPASQRIGVGVSIDGGTTHAVQLIDTVDRTTIGPLAVPFADPNDQVTGIGFGVTSADPGGASLLDVAVVSANGIAVLVDAVNGGISPLCTHDRAASYRVVVAELDAATAGDEIAVAVGDDPVTASAPAQIVITDGATVVAGAVAGPCFDPNIPTAPLLTLDAPGGEPDFGAELLVADFNGNGVPDLVASAASAGVVYVYLDLDVAAPPAPLAVDAGADTGITFGASLAAGDINGDGNDELVVGEPFAAPDGVEAAGSAHIFEFAGGDFEAPRTVHDAQPEANQLFGTAVAVVPFGDGDSLLVVGADREVFTYFRTPVTDDDDVRGE